MLVCKEHPALDETNVAIFLDLSQIINLVRCLDSCRMRSGEELESTLCSTNIWSGPQDHKNKTGKLISVTSTMYVIVHYCKEKAKVLK